MGSVEIDLADYFAHSGRLITCAIQDPQVVSSAEILAVLSVIELTKEEAKKAMEGQIDGDKLFS